MGFFELDFGRALGMTGEEEAGAGDAEVEVWARRIFI